jgi:peroxiredoxin
MYRIIFPFLCLSLFLLPASPALQAQKGPVAGTRHTVTYIAPHASPLASAEQLTMLYVFDFWNTRYGTRLALWQNVLRPDTSRLHSATLVKGPGGWSATIDIPADAALLSYIVGDGTHIDGNNEKTYTSYIYDANGKPLRNARFFNIPFLRLARAELGSIVQEAEREIADFPENFPAYHQYFQLLLEQAKGSARVQERIATRLEQLEKRYGEDTEFLNMAAETWYYVMQDQEKAMEYRSRITPAQQWPQVFRMFDHSAKQEEERQRRLQAEQFRRALVNARLPVFNLHDRGGGKIGFPQADGKVRVIVFWASTSANSARMLAMVREAVQSGAASAIEVLAVSVDTDEQKAVEQFTRENYPFTLLFNQGATLQLLGVDGIPMTYVVDGEGVVRSILAGFEPAHAEALRSVLAAMPD